MVQQPALILADEPVASLDPATADRVLSLLHGICKSDGITAIVSLHQLDFARRYSDRIVGLAQGAVVFDGPREQARQCRGRKNLRQGAGRAAPTMPTTFDPPQDRNLRMINRRLFLHGTAAAHRALAGRRLRASQGPGQAARRAAARRECRNADPAGAAAQGASGEGARQADRADRDHRLFLDDRGDALRPHRDRLFRSVLLCAGEVEGAGHRAVRGRHREGFADLQFDHHRAGRRPGEDRSPTSRASRSASATRHRPRAI